MSILIGFRRYFNHIDLIKTLLCPFQLCAFQDQHLAWSMYQELHTSEKFQYSSLWRFHNARVGCIMISDLKERKWWEQLRPKHKM